APIVAEHALALMLAAARRAWFQTDAVKRGRWGGMDNVFLRGKTLGLLGAGSIAAEAARLRRALGLGLPARNLPPSGERGARLGVRFVGCEELLRTSDAVSVHVPLTERTRGLLGRREFALMKPGALFVNTARGAVVDSAALAEALHSGRLAGAGVDVYEVE